MQVKKRVKSYLNQGGFKKHRMIQLDRSMVKGTRFETMALVNDRRVVQREKMVEFPMIGMQLTLHDRHHQWKPKSFKAAANEGKNNYYSMVRQSHRSHRERVVQFDEEWCRSNDGMNQRDSLAQLEKKLMGLPHVISVKVKGF